MRTSQYFIQPLDILFLRGNRLFGDAGSFGESLIPPWPSVAAGALRSAFLAQQGIDPVQFTRGEHKVSELGTAEDPGSFALKAFHLARNKGSHAGNELEPLFQLPADVVIQKSKNDKIQVKLIRPCKMPEGIACSAATPLLPVLPENERSKSEYGFWLNLQGWKRYLAGKTINCEHLVPSAHLWQLEMRVGIGLEKERRRALEGALFSTQGVVLHKYVPHASDHRQYDVGFLIETVGAEFSESFPLRFGGDGRAAICRSVRFQFPEPDYQEMIRIRCCRMVLTSPGIFSDGWLPTGTVRTETGLHFELQGVRANLTCAVVPRAETISGFDIVKKMPKPAQRAAPCGSVYWLENLEATPRALAHLVREGLWSDPAEHPTRRTEGFNRLIFAAY